MVSHMLHRCDIELGNLPLYCLCHPVHCDFLTSTNRSLTLCMSLEQLRKYSEAVRILALRSVTSLLVDPSALEEQY